MSLLPIYAERFDWLVTQFQDWAFLLVSTLLFYEEKGNFDASTLELYQQSFTVFGEKAPTYHIGLYDDKPRIVWDFHSLLLTIQTLIGFALTDESRQLRICKHCSMAFIAGDEDMVFCGSECEGRHDEGRNEMK